MCTKDVVRCRKLYSMNCVVVLNLLTVESVVADGVLSLSYHVHFESTRDPEFECSQNIQLSIICTCNVLPVTIHNIGRTISFCKVLVSNFRIFEQEW